MHSKAAYDGMNCCPPKPSTYRLFQIRIIVHIRRRAATEKRSGSVAMIVCHAPEDEDRSARADHLYLARSRSLDRYLAASPAMSLTPVAPLKLIR